MRKLFLFFVMVHFSSLLNAQEIPIDATTVIKDTTVHSKTVEYLSKRAFKDQLNARYADEDFVYTEEETEAATKINPVYLGFIKGFIFFMQNIFPFLLGSMLVFIILKFVVGLDVRFWNFKKGKKKVSEKLVYADEDIHEVDLETLLQQAILDSNYRLAVRYYYLSILKDLSTKNLITYHKDKTNSAYTFELKKGRIRDDFSYLTYLYTYVWYGDFPINSEEFNSIHEKYSAFKKLCTL
jgi:hypothetical protein